MDPVSDCREAPPPGYVLQAPDCSYWAEKLLFEHLRSLDSIEKVEHVRSFLRAAHRIHLAGLASRFPQATREELELRAARIRLGNESVQQLEAAGVPPPPGDVVTEGDPFTAAADFADVLEALRIPYVVGGSLASMIHGVRRLTDDVDIALVLESSQVEGLARALAPDFLVVGEAIAEALGSHRSFNAIHRATWTRMDVYVRLPDGHFAEELRRARRVTLNRAADQFARFASAEDIVLEKLRWYELGGRVSEKQWSDLIGVLKLQSDRMDLGYLREWARRLEVSELLERALVQAGLGPTSSGST